MERQKGTLCDLACIVLLEQSQLVLRRIAWSLLGYTHSYARLSRFANESAAAWVSRLVDLLP
jgi:hypothetical protein